MKADEMRAVLGSHTDFKSEKTFIEQFLMEEKGHIVYMLPNFHCKLNPIERVWSQSKRYMKASCKYSIVSIRKLVIPALETLTLVIFKTISEKSDITCLLTWKAFQKDLTYKRWLKKGVPNNACFCRADEKGCRQRSRA